MFITFIFAHAAAHSPTFAHTNTRAHAQTYKSTRTCTHTYTDAGTHTERCTDAHALTLALTCTLTLSLSLSRSLTLIPEPLWLQSLWTSGAISAREMHRRSAPTQLGKLPRNLSRIGRGSLAKHREAIQSQTAGQFAEKLGRGADQSETTRNRRRVGCWERRGTDSNEEANIGGNGDHHEAGLGQF